MEDNYFLSLYQVDVSGQTEKKGNLTYLSWAYAWAEVKKRFPAASYTVYESDAGWNYHTDGRTAWVKVGVTIGGLEHIEYLPVMDNKNRAIPLDAIDSFAVNKSIQRAITKACARHGLGLYIYAGEDLPESPPVLCRGCGKLIAPAMSHGKPLSAQDVASRLGGLCPACYKISKQNTKEDTENVQ